MDNHLTFSELALLIKGDIKQNVPIALFSRPGTGKSSFLKDLASRLNTTVFTIAINQIADRADLTGVRLVDKLDSSGQKYYQQEAFPHATLMEAIQFAEQNPNKPTIIFLDEFNRTTPDVTSATLSFTTERKIGTIAFPDNIRFVLAGNKEGNVVPFDEATATRFAIYDVRPDHLTFLDVNPNLNAYIRDAIVDNPGFLLGEAAPAKGKNAQANPYSQPDPNAAAPDEKEDDVFDPFSEDSGITQERTVPRTLSMLSDWLNGENIDKSGSDEEQQALSEYLQEIEHSPNPGQKPTLLQIAIESKIGQTATALELVHNMAAQHDTLTKAASSTVQSGGSMMSQSFQSLLSNIRPETDLLTTLENISSRSELIEIVEVLDDEERSNMMLWLLTTDAYSTLNGDLSPVVVMEEIAPVITDVDKRTARLFNQIIGHPDNIVKRSIQILKDRTPSDNTTVLSLVSFAETMIE